MMGIFDFIRKQFIDVIDWTEQQDGVLAYRYPMQDMEIQNGAILTVRESQAAVFVNEGTIADVFGPGQHKLTTQTLPLLTNLRNWDKLFASPFKSDVYFFSTRLQMDLKWGTPNPITIRDKDFGMVRLRAFGNYSLRITDPRKFYTEVSGTREVYTLNDFEGQLRGQVLQGMTDMFAQSQIPFLDMAANQNEFANLLKQQLVPAFERLGLLLDNLSVQNISLPEELQTMLDKRISMNMIGNMNQYMQFQTAESIPLAAANPGGLGAIGASMAAGFGMANNMTQAMGSVGNGGGNAGASGDMTIDEVTAAIEKLHALVGKGILTQQEFEAKKQDLLKKIV